MLKTLVIGMALVLGNFSIARATHPEELATECVDAVQSLVDRYENDAASSTRECVRKINALQAAGRDEAAIQVARECVSTATRKARLVGEYIESIRDRCTDVLVDMGAFGLARRVDSACSDSLKQVRNALERQEYAISQAVED